MALGGAVLSGDVTRDSGVPLLNMRGIDEDL